MKALLARLANTFDSVFKHRKFSQQLNNRFCSTPFLPQLQSWSETVLRETQLYSSRQIDRLKLCFLDVLDDSEE
jgi:hypothetical protein